MLVAERDSRVIGFIAYLPCRFVAGGRDLLVMRGVDIAVRPECRGQGIAAALTQAGTAHLPPETSFSMSNPNDMSIGGVRRLGRTPVGRFGLLVRILRPIHAVLGRRRSAAPAPEPQVDAPLAMVVLDDGVGVASLLARARCPADRLVAVKDLDYLRWRYALDHYHAICEVTDGQLRGLAIFCIKPSRATWKIRVCELLVADDDRQVARRLLRRVLNASTADFVVCHFPARSVQRGAALRSGFVPVGSGEQVLVYPLDPTVRPDPTELASWALTLGDLELL